MKRITVIGSGSWATALVKIFSGSQIHTDWLVRTEEQVRHIQAHKRNPRYLSAATLDTAFVHPTTDYNAALAKSQMAVFCMPSSYLPAAVKEIDKELLSEKQLAVSIKGFVPGTGTIPSAYLSAGSNKKDVIVLGGPCHAEEVALERSTYLTVSGTNEEKVTTFSSVLKNHYLRVLSSSDPVGIEYTAILKNIVGIATGIAKGLNYGDNFLAVLISNSMREIHRFLHSLLPGKRDLFDSAYFGDMLVTAYSDYSRNRTLGRLVGRGLPVNAAIQSMEMIAEGFHASRELHRIVQKMGVSLPILTSVYRILHKQASPFHEFKLLEKQLC